MADLGYGGLANTGLTRDFSGKEANEVPDIVYVRVPSIPSIGTRILAVLMFYSRKVAHAYN